MLRKTLAFASAMILIILVLATTVQAANTQYTFNDVEIGEQIVEIEASVKMTNKSDFSTCSYYSDDYMEYLGYYQEAVSAGNTAADALDFCVAHFGDRMQ